ncbi:septum formation initiator family protein [Pelistega suis]|uniref:septum formation initiator family protein n=1 Tax=Pelistega suis TaxID=1631957 RepID=UPI00211B8717|nr:septum formation initiator family protein [Pelistega suis]MCQ9328299.1 septum formation initiator family protein [Pelistega suis]
MRNILVILVLACLAIQYPLRLGDSGYKRVDELNLQLKEQQETNKAMTARNAAMLAEIEDLKSGTQALEDYARTEMSMVDANEVLVRVLPPNEEVPIAPIRIGSQPQPQQVSAAPVQKPATQPSSAQKQPTVAKPKATTVAKPTQN